MPLPDCLRSNRSAYARPGVGIECRPTKPALPVVFQADRIGVECLLPLLPLLPLLAGGRGIRDGVWPGVLAADLGTTVADFLGVANSRIPECDAERGRCMILVSVLCWFWVPANESCDDVDDQLRSSGTPLVSNRALTTVLPVVCVAPELLVPPLERVVPVPTELCRLPPRLVPPAPIVPPDAQLSRTSQGSPGTDESFEFSLAMV